MSRVHELGHLDRIQLIGLLLGLLDRRGACKGAVPLAVPTWSNERIINMIIDLELAPPGGLSLL